MEKQTVLMIEDDPAIREGIRILLEGEGFAVEEAEDGFQGLKLLNARTAIVILDVMMPGISGIRTCREIRKVSTVPILFLTAKDQDSDKVAGFSAGGDDYLVKPFSQAELLGRVKALLRRRNAYDREPAGQEADAGNWLERGDIRVHTKHREAQLRGESLNLSEKEHRLLLLLMQHPTKIFTLGNLYESIWEEEFQQAYGNNVMVCIRKLRKKIEDDPQNPKRIVNVWGKGYRFGQ